VYGAVFPNSFPSDLLQANSLNDFKSKYIFLSSKAGPRVLIRFLVQVTNNFCYNE